jgi:hypothetical protein
MFKFKLGADQVIPGNTEDDIELHCVVSDCDKKFCNRTVTTLLICSCDHSLICRLTDRLTCLHHYIYSGLDIGVAQLSKNERAIMTIPAHLAYGDKGFPGLIPSKSDLIFDIELLEIS